MSDPVAAGGVGAGAGIDRGRELDRVVFFSDAVFAISITVLTLSLRLPAHTTDAASRTHCAKQFPRSSPTY
jgi:uncharacterized membrane protein